MSGSKFILFDFDGTIADTVQPIVGILNEFAKDHGHPLIDQETFERLRGKRNQDALKETGIPPYKALWIARRVRKEIKRRIEKIKPISGIEKVLEELSEKGYRTGIVTTGSRKNTLKFLEIHKIKNFEFVDSGVHFFGKHKIIKKVLKKHKLDPKSVVYIGDQTSDIEAARVTGIQVISVGWGFNSEAILRASEPDFFVSSPAELSEIFSHLQ